MRHSNSTCCLAKKKKGATGLPAAPGLRVDLEDELAAQFEHAWIPRARDLAELALRAMLSPEAVVEPVELRVVEGVERLEAKLEVRPLGHRERLVERGGEVDAARANNRVLAGVAEALVRATQPYRDWAEELARVEPLVQIAVLGRTASDSAPCR